jgi:cytochrome bd-type quinol oxidase subunit 2
VLPWLTPFCLSVGLFVLVLFAYLAASYAPLETEDPELQNDFRIRAIAAGTAVGIMAAVVLLLSINGAPGGAEKNVVLRDGEDGYDYLVVATGATHSYFGHQDWAEPSQGSKRLKTQPKSAGEY